MLLCRLDACFIAVIIRQFRNHRIRIGNTPEQIRITGQCLHESGLCSETVGSWYGTRLNKPRIIFRYGWIRIGNTPEQIRITLRDKLGSGSGTHTLEKILDYVQKQLDQDRGTRQKNPYHVQKLRDQGIDRGIKIKKMFVELFRTNFRGHQKHFKVRSKHLHGIRDVTKVRVISTLSNTLSSAV